jgi:putative endonuclease
MPHYVYFIESEEGFRYTGETSDIVNRLKQHNNKELSFWTKRGNNWKIIYVEEYEDATQARKRERWLKSGVGREMLEKK